MQRVLILRDADLSAPLMSLLLEQEIPCAAVPVTRTEFMHPPRFSLPDFPWIAFTSSNGVRGLFHALNARAHILPPEVRIAVVGAATEATLHELFSRRADLISEEADGSALARTISQSLPAGTDILYPCPGGHDFSFQLACEQKGLRVHSLPVYRTIALAPEIIRRELAQFGEVSAAVFYAPSAVRAFSHALQGPWPFVAIAIGPATERALLDSGHSAVVRSESPKPEMIMTAILRNLPLAREKQHA